MPYYVSTMPAWCRAIASCSLTYTTLIRIQASASHRSLQMQDIAVRVRLLALPRDTRHNADGNG